MWFFSETENEVDVSVTMNLLFNKLLFVSLSFSYQAISSSLPKILGSSLNSLSLVSNIALSFVKCNADTAFNLTVNSSSSYFLCYFYENDENTC